MNGNWETIIQLGTESGGIKLLGKRNESGTWSFRKTIQELDKSVHKEDAETWEDALTLLNDDSWIELDPMHVHSLYSDLVWKKVRNRLLPNCAVERWAKACFPNLMQLIDLLKASSHTVILTGAGMSTESGVPDFRSSSGWWKKIDPRTVATVDALEHNYDLFHEFYSMRVKALTQLAPHRGHELLAEWQEKGLVQLIATQNVDSFHQMAGASCVQSLHGSIRSFRCHECGIKSTEADFLEKRNCENCGGKIRPEVVLFGELLPETPWLHTLQHIDKADLVVVIGTSLEVYPVNQLPSMTKGTVVLLNLEEARGANEFGLTIQGKAKEVLERVDELMQKIG